MWFNGRTLVVLAFAIHLGFTHALGQSVVTEVFGKHPDGQEVGLYTLTNANGLKARVMEHGAILVSLHVPDREGNFANITLGFDSLDAYVTRNRLYGATVGRYANRIANATFRIDGVEYAVTANNRKNHIHGGHKGIDKVRWKGSPFERENESGVRFAYLSKDGEEGFPGNLNCAVTYTLTNSDELQIAYEATTDKPTVINLTNHSYFNLAGPGSQDVMSHEIQINAEHYTPTDDALIPTGEIRSVKGTPLDFTEPFLIGARISQLQGRERYDHNYVLNHQDTLLVFAARVYEPETGRVMEVHTTEPGMQFFTGRGNALCLETQHFPDSPNKTNFPSVILRPGQTYRTRTVYSFSTK
jgi:aldose 1-epimerase